MQPRARTLRPSSGIQINFCYAKPHHNRQRGSRPIFWTRDLDCRLEDHSISHISRMYKVPFYTEYCITLHYTIVYYTLLYSTLLYSTLLYSTLLYSTLLYSTLLYSILHYTILYYPILYYSILDYIILYHTVPLYASLVFALAGQEGKAS